MEDKTLLTIALIISSLGIVFLFFIVQFSSLESISLDNIETVDEDTTIKIVGTVERISAKENATFLDISQKTTITAVIFENVSVQKGNLVEITGKLSEYKGEKEIIVDVLTIAKP
ncbi:hypothetical protein C4573_05315 [Candidatus Woesearchaeota archaeon]|nr:MAG: hypothetical protein C4573_05315 [Candidatus Woesearchaeota archaeon]